MLIHRSGASHCLFLPYIIMYNRSMRDGSRQLFLEKALECLAGAESEFAERRYNNCVNRCYYGCFQSAIAALLHDGILLTGGRTTWGHDFVQAQFVGQLINRRKVYASGLRDSLARNLILRHTADYTIEPITETQAARAVRRTRDFLRAVETREAERP